MAYPQGTQVYVKIPCDHVEKRLSTEDIIHEPASCPYCHGSMFYVGWTPLGALAEAIREGSITVTQELAEALTRANNRLIDLLKFPEALITFGPYERDRIEGAKLQADAALKHYHGVKEAAK